jgi:hypothetical protein
MFKRIGIPVFLLLTLLVVLSAPHANAGVRFGVFVGGPAYGPVYPGYPYVYSDPYPYPYRTYYARPYPYYYSAPVYGYSSRYYWRDRRWREHERHEHDRRYRR